MRTFAIVISVIIIMGLLIISENYYLKEFCNNAQAEISKIEKNINNNEEICNLIRGLVSEWDMQKKKIFTFVNHNSFKEIENSLFDLKYYIYTNDKTKTIYHINSLRHKLHELKEINEFNLSNIL